MKRTTNIIWGIVLVALGLIFALNALEITRITVFFDGWWTLIIIIPCTVGLFKEKDKTGNIVGIIIGIVLLLACQGIINFKIILKLLIPAVIIIIGLALIFKDTLNKKTKDAIKKLNAKNASNQASENAVFSSLEADYTNRLFEGIELNAVFGGVKLDIKNAVINEDAVINSSAVFGGIDIIAPEDVNIKVSSTSIFGGVSDKRSQKCKDSSVTVYINATCLFGGVDIK